MNIFLNARFFHKNNSRDRFIFIILMIIIIQKIYSEYFQQITLKIKGPGIKTIFGNQGKHIFNEDNYPNSVNINGQSKFIVSYF